LSTSPPSNPAIQREDRPIPERNLLSTLGALLALGVGGFFLVAWLAAPEAAEWTGFRMKTNTALCLVMASLSLLLVNGGAWPSRVSAVLATATAFIGLATLLQYLAGVDLRLDQLLARDFPAAETRGFPNRMSPIAAVMMLVSGTGLVLLSPRRPHGVALAGHALSLAALAICLLAGVGYLYEASALYQPTRYIRISPFTTCAGIALTLGMLAARPDLGMTRLMVNHGPGGFLARRLILLAGLAPMVLGWLRLEGEKLGLYSTETGTSLLVLFTMASFVLVVAILARTLDRVDVRRRQAEGQVRSSSELTASLARAATHPQVVEETCHL
jgi:hypothetical protein